MDIIKQEEISYPEYLQYMKNSKYNFFNDNYAGFLCRYGKKQKKIKMKIIWENLPIELWFIIKDYFLINTENDFRKNILVKLTVTHDKNFSECKFVPEYLKEIYEKYRELYSENPIKDLVYLDFEKN